MSEKKFINVFKSKPWIYLFPLVIFLLSAVTYKVAPGPVEDIPVNTVFCGFGVILWVWTIAVNEFVKGKNK